jgi:hypothetical protein
LEAKRGPEYRNPDRLGRAHGRALNEQYNVNAQVGGVRTCKLGLRRPEEEGGWIESYGQLWDARFNELDKVVEKLKCTEKPDGE